MKTITRDEVLEIFTKKTNPKKVEILYDALDHMQRYNWNSKLNCIALAMGYERSTEDDDLYIK